MEFRLAEYHDLKQLKSLYQKIIKNMNENDIQIWDDVYPCEFFEKDIINRQLYILLDKKEILSAFVLSNTNSGEDSVKWENINSKALYLDCFAVSIKHTKKGIGNLMVIKAKQVAKKLGAEYLRLFVADINKLAIHLYEKNDFIKVAGFYDLIFNDGFALKMFGYEVKL